MLVATNRDGLVERLGVPGYVLERGAAHAVAGDSSPAVRRRLAAAGMRHHPA